MTSATASRSYVAVIKQTPSTPRVIPTNPVMQKVNFTSDDLKLNVTTKESAHIRSDRSTTDLTRVGYAVDGGYNFEWQYENSLTDGLLLSFLWCQQYTVNVAKNGSFYQPFFIERGHTDVAQYFRFIGMACNKMTLNFPDQGEVTGSYQFVGMESSINAAVVAGATYVEATTAPVFSTVYHISQIAIDGTPLSSCLVKDMTLEINNNVTPKTGLGVLGACETLPHKLSITGKITIYFTDAVMYTRFTAGTAFSLSVSLLNGTLDGYTILLPKVKINADTVPVTGADANVMENVTYTALYDAGEACVIKVTRVVHV